ncbi:MAG: hypothetical protein L6R35_001426 [Caloplaca aegaea]|nr:MAG: hypothetical protein L6R35_001426 [Caloplaca aegaea]
MSASLNPEPPPWYMYLNIDLLLHVGSYTIFHPFVAAMLPLCLRALAAPYESTSFILTAVYAVFVSLCYLLSSFNHRWAYGPPRTVELLNEVAVVTGGASGLGRCIVEIYAMKGVSVAAIDIDVKEEGEREGIWWYKCDVGDQMTVEKTWSRINRDLGIPTILINNAAIVNGKPFFSLTGDEVERTYRVNTLSHFHLASLFLLPLTARGTGGTLVTVSSILGRLGASNLTAYTGSKASAIAFHTSLAAELRNTSNIKMLLVTPGQLDTAMFGYIKLGWIRNFFGPVLEVRELAIKIVNTINAGEGGTIALPAYARWIAWQQILPKAIQDSVRRWTGVDTAIMGSPVEQSSSKTEVKNSPSGTQSESESESN